MIARKQQIICAFQLSGERNSILNHASVRFSSLVVFLAMFDLAAGCYLTLSFWEGRLELVGSVSSKRGHPFTVVGWLHVNFSENTFLRGEAIEASIDMVLHRHATARWEPRNPDCHLRFLRSGARSRRTLSKLANKRDAWRLERLLAGQIWSTYKYIGSRQD